MAREPKSEWEGVYIGSDQSKDACRSWFCGMADDHQPIKANILTRVADDRTLKIRALFEQPDGKTVEMVRTLGREFTITIGKPTAQRWVA